MIHKPRGGLALRGLVFAAALAMAAPGWAGHWSFASDGPLVLGGTVSGQFSAMDANADSVLQANEVSDWQVSYQGVPPGTSSFSINKLVLDATDRFSFDLLADVFSFEVLGANGLAISGGNFEFTQVSGDGFVDSGANLQVNAVPEGSSMPLVLCGLAGLMIQRRRQRR